MKSNKKNTKVPEVLDLPQEYSPNKQLSIKLPFTETIQNIKSRAGNTVSQELQNYRKTRIDKLQQLRQSKIIVYYSFDSLDFEDSSQFYEILNAQKISTNIDIFLLSPGGFSGPAFKMSRMCQEFAKANNVKFSILVPYYAKSAATIFSLGAHEIVMGPASELGPIDPQIQSNSGQMIPLLALKDALKYLEEKTKNDPNNAGLYWPLLQQVDLMSLGKYEREIESSRQYAIQLLNEGMFKENNEKSIETADKLVNYYKNHGYIIDRKEAKDVLGLNIVDASEEEWEAMWQLHKLYDDLLTDSIINNGVSMKVFETIDLFALRQSRLRKGNTSTDDKINDKTAEKEESPYA